MFERFTRKARMAIAEARAEAEGQEHVGTEHLLLGVLRLGTGMAFAVLAQAGIDVDQARRATARHVSGVDPEALAAVGIDLDAVRSLVDDQFGDGALGRAMQRPKRKVLGAPPFTPKAKEALALALREALTMQHNYIGTEHILLGLLRLPDSVAAKALRELAPDVDLRAAVLAQLRKAS